MKPRDLSRAIRCTPALRQKLSLIIPECGRLPVQLSLELRGEESRTRVGAPSGNSNEGDTGDHEANDGGSSSFLRPRHDGPFNVQGCNGLMECVSKVNKNVVKE